MKEIVIKIFPGGDAYFLYSDDSPLRDMGKLELRRASQVEWDEKLQRWLIKVHKASRTETDKYTIFNIMEPEVIGKPEGYESRVQAIADEVVILNAQLDQGLAPHELGFRDI